jgi:hypothetical protein
MYGIIIEVRVDPNREEEARKMLHNIVIPRAKTHPGIAAGYFLRELDGDILRCIELYDTEINAQTTAKRIQSEGPPPGAPVTLSSVNVYEVIGQV